MQHEIRKKEKEFYPKLIFADLIFIEVSNKFNQGKGKKIYSTKRALFNINNYITYTKVHCLFKIILTGRFLENPSSIIYHNNWAYPQEIRNKARHNPKKFNILVFFRNNLRS